MSPKILLVLAVASLAAFVADPALARQNRGRKAKARAVLVADDASAIAGAKLSIRLRGGSNGRWEFRMQIERAPLDLAPEAWIAGADGVLVLVGSLTPDDDLNGEYKLRLRGGEGDPLPAGAATFADLGGRAFEIRNADAAILVGNLPEFPAAASSTGGGSGGGADDPANHDAGDDHGTGADDPATHDANDDNGGTTTTGSTTSTSTTTTSSGSGSGNRGNGNSGSGNSGRGSHDGAGHR